MSRCKDWGTPHDHAHGTTSGWSYHGCCCPSCETAHYSYHRDYDRQRSSKTARRTWVLHYTRSQRAAGNPVYANRGNGESHRNSGWAAQRRYRERNRGLVNSTAIQRRANLRDSVAAQRKWWTPEDDAIVLRGDICLTEMAYILKRTPSAIAQRRYRLRKSKEVAA